MLQSSSVQYDRYLSKACKNWLLNTFFKYEFCFKRANKLKARIVRSPKWHTNVQSKWILKYKIQELTAEHTSIVFFKAYLRMQLRPDCFRECCRLEGMWSCPPSCYNIPLQLVFSTEIETFGANVTNNMLAARVIQTIWKEVCWCPFFVLSWQSMYQKG